jgi:PKD repeat protein
MNIARVKVFMALISALVVPVALAGPPLPELPAPAQGERAIQMLGEHLPDVAKHYGWETAELRNTMEHDHDLWVDQGGNLLYICEGMAVAAGEASAETATVPVSSEADPVDDTFLLHSRPNASKVIFLDFDGHVTSGTYWNSNFNNGQDIVSTPFNFEGDNTSFSSNELARIRYIWQRVAEDFAPFDVDVTTEDPGVEALRRSSLSDQAYGVRVVISPTIGWFGSNAGGVAYIGSFNWNTDTPCFAFTEALLNGEKYIAEAASHETGHTLGLRHDGTKTGTEYYAGHGSGETGWAPIMGVGYYQNLVQWSKGEYANANNTEDDLAVMQNYGITYVADDHGGSAGAATVLPAGTTLNGGGLIGQRSDVDVFKFSAGAGTVSIQGSLHPRAPNLDIVLQLFDANGSPVASANPIDALAASFNVTVAGGDYYLHVDGIGKGDPATGYSDYGSLGEYTISGTVPALTGNNPPLAAASANPASGEAPLDVAFDGSGSSDSDGVITDYAWDFGDGQNGSGAAASHTYAAAGTYTAVLTVTDDDGATDTDSVTILVTEPVVTNYVLVDRIDLIVLDVAGGKAGEATVYVVDQTGAPVAGVTVSGEWGGVVSGGDSAVTGPYGMATFTSRKTKKTGTVTFTVTALQKDGYVYDPSLNRATTASASTDGTTTNQKPVASISANPVQGTPPLTVSFDGSASTDPDGVITLYSWDFGDGSGTTGETVEHSYDALGTYQAVLTVTDDQGASDTDAVTITVTDGTLVATYVADISMALVSLPGKRVSAEATVSVLDANGIPVAGATVAVTWSGAAAGTGSAVTDAVGQAVLTSGAIRDRGTFTVTVTDVTKAGTAYDPSLNVETSDSITY